MEKFLEKAILNQLKKKFLNSKYQARHRNQEWGITRQQFIDLWMENDRWIESGVKLHSLSLCRIDLEKGWTIDNVKFLTRKEMLARPQRGAMISEARAKKRI